MGFWNRCFFCCCLTLSLNNLHIERNHNENKACDFFVSSLCVIPVIPVIFCVIFCPFLNDDLVYIYIVLTHYLFIYLFFLFFSFSFFLFVLFLKFESVIFFLIIIWWRNKLMLYRGIEKNLSWNSKYECVLGF